MFLKIVYGRITFRFSPGKLLGAEGDLNGKDASNTGRCFVSLHQDLQGKYCMRRSLDLPLNTRVHLWIENVNKAKVLKYCVCGFVRA